MPKGSLLKQYLPVGVMKVVRRREEGERGICQKPLLASNFEKTLAPASCASVSSTLGSGWTSLSTLRLSGFSTIPAHHGVGSDTFDITPAFSILSSSSATLERRGRGT